MTNDLKSLSADSLAAPAIELTCDPEQRIDEWRQIHHAAQALSEVGKLWAQKQPDDSHTAMSWDAERRAFVRTGEGIVGRFPIAEFRLEIGAPDSDPELFPLSGNTLDDALGFVRTEGEKIAGPAKQESVPAPDLPDHAVGRGASFDESGGAALTELAGLYDSASALLESFRDACADGDASEVETWPHHFDMAVLVVLERAGDGAMTKTIGVGLTPPDSVEASGYFYVSPWAKGGAPQGGGDIGAGRRSGHMALLPISTLEPLEAQERGRALAGFVAKAWNACAERLIGG